MNSSTLLVLHELGDAGGGGPWRSAFEAAGWTGSIHAPDLPGHGATPAPLGGNYELGDALFALLPLLQQLRAEDEAPVVVGIGVNGWCAQLLAVGRRASALVLVDGLGGPWLDARQAIAAGRDRLRAIADDSASMASAPRSGLDPRTRHGVGGMTGRRTVEKVLTELAVPLLAIETPRTTLDHGSRADLLYRSTAPVHLVEVTDREPATVAPAVVSELPAFILA